MCSYTQLVRTADELSELTVSCGIGCRGCVVDKTVFVLGGDYVADGVATAGETFDLERREWTPMSACETMDQLAGVLSFCPV